MTGKLLAYYLKYPRVPLVVRVPQFENHCHSAPTLLSKDNRSCDLTTQYQLLSHIQKEKIVADLTLMKTLSTYTLQKFYMKIA